MLSSFRYLLVCLLLAIGAGWPASAQQRAPVKLWPTLPDSIKNRLRHPPAAIADRIDDIGEAGRWLMDLPDTAGAFYYLRLEEQLARQHGEREYEGIGILWQANLYIVLQDIRHATPLARRAVAVLDGTGTSSEIQSHIALGVCYRGLGVGNLALREFRRARQLVRLTPDSAQYAQALSYTAEVHRRAGMLDSAIYYQYRALALYRRQEENGNAAMVMSKLAVLMLAQGHGKEALRLLHQAYAEAEANGYPMQLPSILCDLGNTALQIDSLPTAERAWRLALAKLQEYPNPMRQAAATSGLAQLWVRRGQFDSAEVGFRRALRVVEGSGLTSAVGLALTNLADCQLRRGRLAEADATAARALALDTVYNDSYTTKAWLIRQRAAAARGDLATAYDIVRRLRSQDSLRTVRHNAELAESMRIGYETEQAESRARVLEQELENARLRRQQQSTTTAALVGLGILLVGGGLWRIRLRQRHHEQQLRTQLAADLHDDVGSLLGQISIQSALIREGLAGDPEQQRHQLDEVTQACRTAVGLLNDVVWALDSHNDPLPNLVNRLRDHAHQVLPAAGIAVQFQPPMPDLPTAALPVIARRNLYLIFKESVYNVVKHSGATAVVVELKHASGRFEMSVRDNGTGPAASKSGSGHGLRNIARRAEEAGGGAITGPPADGSSGFEVRVWVPVKGW